MSFRVYCPHCEAQIRPPYWSQFGLAFCSIRHAQLWKLSKLSNQTKEKTREQQQTSEQSRFDYVAYDSEAQQKQASLKEKFMEIDKMVSELLPPGRAQSLVFTKIEEAYMWTGKAIRDEQRSKRVAILQEQRNHE